MKKVLVTCPPMIEQIHTLKDYAASKGLSLQAANVIQTLTEEELIDIVPQYDGWIIGDDPATRTVFQAGKNGSLTAAVKWGIGIDNVDFKACEEFSIPIINTPNMFGGEVADVAIGYLVGLARQLFYIDREIRVNNQWPKPAGMSISGKHIGVVGFGDIGFQVAKRLGGFDVKVTAYDPGVEGNGGLDYVSRLPWCEGLGELDFLIFTCSLNERNHHMLNHGSITLLKKGSFVINVARGPLINEVDLLAALKSGHITAAALDVFEQEPLPVDSELRNFPNCIFGSHNSSNTIEAVHRASIEAIDKLAGFLDEQ